MSEEIVLRWYQQECAEAGFNAVKNDKDCHPLLAIPTAGGKSLILCEIINLFLSDNCKSNVLVLSHNSEILEQNHEELENYFEGSEVGLYSSTLKSKTVKKVTVAQIQSAYRKPELFYHFDLIIIDECHLIPNTSTTMYRSFLEVIQANYIGLTATPFRTGSGYLHEGEKALFTHLAYDLTSMENFNRLVSEGYLSQLFSKSTKLKLNVDGVKTIAGDFSPKDMSEIIDRDSITEAAINETLMFGDNYKQWLFFAINIKHAENITEMLISKGVSAICVHSKMERKRSEVLKEVRNGKYRAIVNVDILTTGFNLKNIDLICLLRPTKSPIIHVQTIGRGLRVIYKKGMPLQTAEQRLKAIEFGGKPHCLVLDYAGNCSRLGAVNDVKVKTKGKKDSGGSMIKVCPECDIENHLSAKVCCNCEYIFPVKEKIVETASIAEVVKKTKKQKLSIGWHEIDEIDYSLKRSGKGGKNNYIKATYSVGDSKVHENIFLENRGYAKHLAQHWVSYRWQGYKGEEPKNCIDLFKNMEYIKQPQKIKVKIDEGKRYEIIDASF
jgi:DNA repair protein RadD